MRHPEQIQEDIARLQNKIRDARLNRSSVSAKYTNLKATQRWGQNSFDALDSDTSFKINIQDMNEQLIKLDNELATALYA